MPKKHTPDARMTEMRDAFLQHAKDLWDQHESEFSTVLQEAEAKKLRLTFSATLDFTESKALMETNMSFSQVVKDKRTAEFDDPNALRLDGIEEHVLEEVEKKRSRGRPRKEVENETAGEAA